MSEESLSGQYAGFISRLIAFGIDFAIVTIILLVMTWLVNAVLTLFNLDQITGMETMQKIAWSGVIALLFSAAYFIFFWTLAGQTPGKTLMGLRIVTTDGQPLSVGRSVRRFLGYIVSISAMWIGFLWILLDNRRQGWHDKIAGTFVIYAWDARAGSYLADWYQRKQEERRQSGQES
ncbi:MAG: RDD family protein [Candidatus Promineifilaceae bacterium]